MISFKQAHISFINRHWPTCTDTSNPIITVSHPKRPSPFFTFCPIFWRWQALLCIQADGVHLIQSHHSNQSCPTTDAHPSPWEAHHLEFVGGNETPSLRVSEGHERFAYAFHLIELDVLSCSSVEDILMVHIFVGNGGCVTPHNVAQADRWAPVRG